MKDRISGILKMYLMLQARSNRREMDSEYKLVGDVHTGSVVKQIHAEVLGGINSLYVKALGLHVIAT